MQRTRHSVQPAAARASSGMRARAASHKELLLGTAGVLSLLVVWQLVVTAELVSSRAIPPPIQVFEAGRQLLSSGDTWLAIAATLEITLIGIAAVVVIAYVLAVVIHSSRFIEDSTWFIIEFLKPIPGVALIPLVLLLWGPGFEIKLFLIIFGALWPMLTQLLYGFREVSAVARDMARVYQLSPSQRAFRVVLPSVLPFFMTGLRISITLALIIAIVTEYIVGIPGIGELLATAQLNGVIDQAFALLILSGVLGLTLAGLVNLLAKLFLFWHPAYRKKVD